MIIIMLVYAPDFLVFAYYSNLTHNFSAFWSSVLIFQKLLFLTLIYHTNNNISTFTDSVTASICSLFRIIFQK